ncbi:MAG: hypothetical protein JWP14_2710, partial [Frankiales bacterium]|nr:hypothetical protein [Frankiales bacterium]
SQADFDTALASRDALLTAVSGGSQAKAQLRAAATLLEELMPTLEAPDEELMREVFAALDVKATVTSYDPLGLDVGGRLDFSALISPGNAGDSVRYPRAAAGSRWR